MTLLFSSRLFLYLVAIILPFLHPSIAVSYDTPSLVLWFFLVPWEGFVAFFSPLKRASPKYGFLLWLLPLLTLPILTAGFSEQAFRMMLLGGAAYLTTRCIFFFPTWGRRIAFLEPFALAVLYIRLLNFFRASEEAARGIEQNGALPPQVLMGIFLGAFLLHCLVLFLTLYQGIDTRTRFEGGLFLGGAVLMGLLLIFLPPNYVQNTVVTNLLQHEVNPPPVPLDAEGDGLPNGNLRPRRDWPEWGRMPGRRDGSGRRNRLEGIPQDQWPGMQGRNGQGEAMKQYTVMVVASERDPLYLADQYRGHLHPVDGFIPFDDEPLNELARIRLLETWRDRKFNFDLKRQEVPFFALSTLGERYLPYDPYTIEPTIFHRQYRPFLFQFRGSSLISHTSIHDWKEVRELSPEEQHRLAPYLEVFLTQEDRQVFETFLAPLLEGTESYSDRIVAILEGFSTFQYTLGYQDDTSLEALIDFITFTREGDCTEFSNTAALLARLAGIPSRVVTGYLASSDLQTAAHIRGLAILRQALPPLEEFPLEELFLVTTAHRHSWAQFWLPRYGWVDFEATSFAIPPLGMGDPNALDVVIPIIEGDPLIAPVPTFPWRRVFNFLLLALGIGLSGLYVFRHGREAWYLYLSRRGDVRAARALYRLLLLRLAGEGYPLKPASSTPLEYTSGLEKLKDPLGNAGKEFASLYTELAYRTRMPKEEQVKKLEELRNLFADLIERAAPKGFPSLLRRIFSLKGLGYTW